MSPTDALPSRVHTRTPTPRSPWRDRLPSAWPARLAQLAANWIRRAKQLALIGWHAGGGRHCPLCQSSIRRFEKFGVDPRPDALCPFCGSLERHRMAWLFFERRTNLAHSEELKMLHFAPEPVLQKRFRAVKSLRYISADLADPQVVLRADITRIPCADETFHLAFCSHVLEHVADDRAAMRELRRVIAVGGWLICQVPIGEKPTFEDPSISDPEERLRLFGQSDHVRIYGPDVADRLSDAGFDVAHVTARDIASPYETERYGLADESLFFCS